MNTVPLQLSDVIYNAASQTFEALVTVHERSGTRRYACEISAPIDMEFEDAAEKLTIQAMRRHRRGDVGSILQFTKTTANLKPAKYYSQHHSRAA